MIRNPTIHEFEAMATMRTLLDRFVDPTSRFVRRARFAYDECLVQSVYACNDILRDLGINRELWVRIRGKRAYMFHEPTRRIVAEVGIITDDAGDGWRRRLKVELMGKGGMPVKEPTIGDLAVTAQKLGKSRPHNRMKYMEVHHG